MKKQYLFLCYAVLISCFTCSCQNTKQIIATDAKVEMLADGFSFTEGPASDKEGNVYFTDQPNNLIIKWSIDSKLTTFMEESGRANGLYFDNENNLLSCSDAENEIWRIDTSSKHEVLVSNFEGALLNGPNDLWVDARGGIYFTDPLYKRGYWTRDPQMQQKGEYVYYLPPKSTKPIIVELDLKKPNGIVGTKDGKLLYVADIGDNKTYVYQIQDDGTLTNKKLFASLGSDGMTIDSEGNIYLTGKGVTVFNSQGIQIEHIPIDANWTSNVCFGGKDKKTLFITASQYLYCLKMNVKGVK